MKVLAGVAALATLLGAPAWGLSERACSEFWTKADADGDGMLKGAEASGYLAAIRRDGRIAPDNGHIGRPRFMQQCRAGVYAARGDPKAPLTEAQARKRAAAAGYGGITDMVKDADGIWRGETTVEGRTIDVIIDSTGKLTAHPVEPDDQHHSFAPRPWEPG